MTFSERTGFLEAGEDEWSRASVCALAICGIFSLASIVPLLTSSSLEC